MVPSQLSASSQNYLKAVWTLGEWSDEPVTASTIAAKVGVRLSTASDAIRKLSDQGFLAHAPYGAVTLTDKGLAVAIAMVRRHRLIEAFLVETLGYRADQVHEEAEVLEHAVSDLLIERIDAHLGEPERDPHGDPIPRADGSLPALGAHSLAEFARSSSKGEVLRIERIADDDPELVRFLAEQGIVYGAEVILCEASPYSEAVALKLQGTDEELSFGLPAARSIWVGTIESQKAEN